MARDLLRDLARSGNVGRHSVVIMAVVVLIYFRELR